MLRPLSEVVSFLEKPENLELITPTTLEIQITSPKPIEMFVRKSLNSIFDYRKRVIEQFFPEISSHSSEES